MKRLTLLVSLLAFASFPAFGYNLVNASWTEVCIFSTSCSVTVTDYSPTILGSGKLQTRIYQGQPGSTGAGKYVYEYRIDLTQVAGITSIPYADQVAIYNTGTPLMFDYNFNGVATDQVYNITSGGLGTKGLSAAFLSGGWTYLNMSSPVYGGSFPGDGESSYFFGFASDYAPTLRTIWVHTDSGWVSVTGYAPNAP